MAWIASFRSGILSRFLFFCVANLRELSNFYFFWNQRKNRGFCWFQGNTSCWLSQIYLNCQQNLKAIPNAMTVLKQNDKMALIISWENYFLLSKYRFKVSYKETRTLRLNLHVHDQQWKHQNNVWNLFKVNIKDTRMTSMRSFWCLYC